MWELASFHPHWSLFKLPVVPFDQTRRTICVRFSLLANPHDEFMAAPKNDKHSAMPNYRYVLHDGAIQTETLGNIELSDDAEAVAFGQRVMREMKRPASYAGCAMKIMEGERTAGEVLFATSSIGSSPSELTPFEI